MALHTHGNLGNVLQPRQSTPVSHAGPSPLGGGRSQTMDKFGTLLSDPRMKAFMLNLAANLLTQQGIATSMGRGLEGMGRFETANRQMQIAREQAAAKAKGGGGGGGKGEKPIDNAALIKRRDELMEILIDSGDPAADLGSDALMAKAMALALAEQGDTSALEVYNGLSDEEKVQHGAGLGTPDVARAAAAKHKKDLADWRALSDKTYTPPADSTETAPDLVNPPSRQPRRSAVTPTMPGDIPPPYISPPSIFAPGPSNAAPLESIMQPDWRKLLEGK